jgi:hypothetical protein
VNRRRALLDAKLTELVLFAKQLCPSAAVEGSAIQYEDEDGRVEMFLPAVLSEAEEDRAEMAFAGRAARCLRGDVGEVDGRRLLTIHAALVSWVRGRLSVKGIS